MRRWSELPGVVGMIALAAGWCVAVLPRVAAAQAAPYEAVVTEDKVEVRAGASRTFYVVGELSRGTHVTVAEVFEDWLKIQPPPGVYSYISKMFVDARGDGKTGTVNTDEAVVKAASANPLELSYKQQAKLPKGATVQIVGEEASYYKIVPPKEAYVFLPPGSARPAQAEAPPPAVAPEAPKPLAAAPAPAKPAEPATKETPAEPTVTKPQLRAAPTEAPKPFETVEPVKPAAPAPAPAPAPAAAPAPPAEPRVAVPESAALKAAEQRLAEASTLPLVKQPLTELLASYQALAGEPNLALVDRRIVAVRVGQLKRNMEIAAGLKALQEAQDVGSAPIDIKPAAPTVAEYNPSKYDLVGQLLASGVYDGQTGPRLFRLVEPASMRTLAYVQAGRKFDPRQSLGRIVGIIGQTRYDPALKLRVVEVEKLDLLEPVGGAAPVPAAVPATAPAPSGAATPAPAPTTRPAVDGKPAGGDADLMK